ncbi:MAG: hypothetical protein ACI8V2_002572 [Candidatus Latescibacterota bacterium]|jgi:hypothetical protein
MAVDGGRWTMDDGRWTVDDGPQKKRGFSWSVV